MITLIRAYGLRWQSEAATPLWLRSSRHLELGTWASGILWCYSGCAAKMNISCNITLLKAQTRMKLSLSIAAAVLISIAPSHAQGTIVFANNRSTAIYLPGGQPVPSGPAFSAELMYAHDGTPDGAFDLVASRLGATTFNNVVFPGVFYGGVPTAPTPIPGGYGLFQVRVWETEFGSSYAEAVTASPIDGRYALVGTSPILRIDTGDPTNPPSEPTQLVGSGFQGFTLTAVPEPSMVWIAIASLVAFGGWHLLGRRK